MNKEEIASLVKAEIATVLRCEADCIDDNESLLRLGVSSVQAIRIVNQVRRRICVDLSPIAIFEYSTIEQFAQYISTLESVGDSEYVPDAAQ